MPELNASAAAQAERLRRAILQRHGYRSNDEVPFAGAHNPIDEATRLATISSHWAIVSYVPLVGRLIVVLKRAMRIVLRWYINPIVDQQNAFNDAVVRTLYDLQMENDRLRALIAEQASPEADG